jgi:group I intron endonuclease
MGYVYLVTNQINSKQYIGKTLRTLAARKEGHEASAYRKSKLVFHQALRKYSCSSFQWRIIYSSDVNEKLMIAERVYIRLYKTKVPYGYNLTDGGEGNSGWVPSRSTRRKIGNALRGKVGHPSTPEINAKISRTQLGKVVPARVRKKMSESAKRRASTPKGKLALGNAMLGKHHSESTKSKISQARKGHPVSQETRDKISKSKIGRPGKIPTEETRRKMSQSRLGRVVSEETRRKLSLSMLGNQNTIGRSRTDEEKQRIRETLKATLARKKSNAQIQS